MDLQVSPVFLANQQSNKRITINQGGTRSGKTYSILQLIFFWWCQKETNLVIDIVRKTQTELRDTVYHDAIEILKNYGLYKRKNHNKSNYEYSLNGNLIRFIGLDKAQKKRGAKRDILFINEANGLTLEDWVQLSIRTTRKIYIDFNPSEYFWVNEQILERDPAKFDLIKSTYLDNYDFLPAEQIKEIEDLILIDDFYYKVYVLGELAVMRGKIFNNYKIITPEEYDQVHEDFRFYGLDFGYEHATALVEIKWAAEQTYERSIYFAEKKYDDDLIKFMDKQGLSVDVNIWADPAYPASIRKIRDAGYTCRKAKKDVRDTIRFCQGLTRNICSSSTKYIRQMDRYKYKQTPDGKIVEEPVKIDDDGPDAFRYGAYNELRKIFNPLGVE